MQRRRIRSTRERGSVLVVVLGLLVIMTLMGTVFLTTVSLHRDVAESQSKSARARMAANAGLAHAIGVLRGDAILNTTTTFDSKWNSITTFRGTVVGVDATSMFAYAGMADPYPNDAAHNGIGKWLGLDGTAAVTPSQVIADGNSNKAGQYDENWKILTNAAGDGAKVRYLVRYAVSMVDLEGRLPINKDGAEAVTFKDNVGQIANQGLTTFNASNMATLFDKSPPSISWDHASKDYGGTFSGTESMLVTPFGISDLPTLGPRINANTAPIEILKGLIERTKTNIEAVKPGEGTTPDANTWATAVIAARVTPLAGVASLPNSGAGVAGYTSVRALAGLQGVSNSVNYDALAAGRLFVGPSRFYRGVVRGQVYDREREEAVAEVNLEFVYYLDLTTIANSHVLFKRWVVK